MSTNDTLIARIHTQNAKLDSRISEAMRRHPRDQFVQDTHHAFEDIPLDIGYGQTATAPSLVAAILDIAQIQTDHRVLEIGTGSGYQTALIAHISNHVTSLDIIPAFTQHAREVLQNAALDNIDMRTQDGHIPCGDAQFDRIIINAAVREVPPALLTQLRPHGSIIVPLDKRFHHQKIATISCSDIGKVQTTAIRSGFLGLTQLRGLNATI